jgi:hypothetical protein
LIGCDHTETKLRNSRFSSFTAEGAIISRQAPSTMKGNNDTSLGKLLQTRMKAIPGSKEWKAVDGEIKKVDDQLEKRVPDDRHKQRMSALYVDAISLGRWNRLAKDFSQQRAREFLSDAVND